MLNRVRNFLVSTFTPKHRAEGIDGSHWWGVWNPTLATKPIHFAIVKATEGTGWVDSAFNRNAQASLMIPIRGAYHYQRSGMSWLKQADFFLRVAGQYDLHIYALDVEKYNNTDAFEDQAAADTFFSDMRRIIDYWRLKAPEKTIYLYTNPDIYYNHIVSAIKRIYGQEGMAWLDEVEKWIAVYNGQGKDGNPTSKWGIPKWSVWQYSSNGIKTEYGTQGDVDLNVYNGTAEEMQARVLKGQPEPSPTPTPVPTPTPREDPEPLPETWAGRVIAFERVIVRNHPTRIDDTDTGLRLFTGDRVSGQLWAGNGYVWMRLDNSNPRKETRGHWVAVRKDGGDKFIKLEQPDAPTIPPGQTTGLFRVVWDDENPDLNNKCRTQSDGFVGPLAPPAVMQYYPEMREKAGRWRCDLADPHNWKQAIIDLNGGDVRKFEYLIDPSRATFNDQGWPLQQYLTMSGNLLKGELLGKWFKFETLKPGDLAKVKAWTIETHPQFVHRFTCVKWKRRADGTFYTHRIESTGTQHGQVYFFLVSNEGYGYIPARHVKKV